VRKFTQMTLTLFLVIACLRSGNAQDSPCDVARLPYSIRQNLEKNFSGWRVYVLTDLSKEYVEMWLKAHPRECPGIAAAYSRSEHTISYAILLIPVHGSGYKLVVFDNPESSKIHVTLLQKTNKSTPTPSVIYKVPPGRYSDPERAHRKNIRTEGFVMEQLEVGSILYYWDINRYRALITSN